VGQSTLSRFGFFNQGFLADDDDDAGSLTWSGGGRLEVVADLVARGG